MSDSVQPHRWQPTRLPVPGILQARTLEWGVISFSNAWKWNVKVKSLSCAWLFATPWTAAYQAPPSMGFSWQEYWSGVPLPSLDESLLSLISKTNWFTCGLYWRLQTTSQAFLPQLPGFSLLTLLPMLFKYVLLLAHHRHSNPPPKKKNTHTRRGIKQIWPDFAAIWEANYFSPYIQCQFVRKTKKSYLNTYIFSAALCSLPYLLSSMIIKTLQLSQRSHITWFSSLSLFLNSVDFPEVDHPLFFTCLFFVFWLIW